jgi:hypothetical protein
MADAILQNIQIIAKTERAETLPMKTRFRFFRILPLLLLTLTSCRLYEPERYVRLTPTADSIRVLMIGDSLTYYNDMPGLLQQFTVHEPHPIDVERRTFPYCSLATHLDHGAAERIKEGRFDYVVLQDFSRLPVTDPQTCIRSYERYNDVAKGANSKIIIFENWTRAGMDDDFPKMRETYRIIEERTGGIRAPIGTAFRNLRAARPDIKLLLDDRHPSDAASYLIACVLYDVIYHKKSSDLPWDLQGPKLSSDVMSTLRGIADRTVAEMR